MQSFRRLRVVGLGGGRAAMDGDLRGAGRGLDILVKCLQNTESTYCNKEYVHSVLCSALCAKWGFGLCATQCYENHPYRVVQYALVFIC